MSDYLNNNGLINGKIPAGKACPFYKECTYFVQPSREVIGCPTENIPRNIPLSCGAAIVNNIEAWSIV